MVMMWAEQVSSFPCSPPLFPPHEKNSPTRPPAAPAALLLFLMGFSPPIIIIIVVVVVVVAFANLSLVQMYFRCFLIIPSSLACLVLLDTHTITCIHLSHSSLHSVVPSESLPRLDVLLHCGAGSARGAGA